MSRFAPLLVLLAGCASVSIRPPSSDIEIDCSRAPTNCPTFYEVERALDLFADEYPAFDVKAPLILEWYPYHSVIKGRSWAETVNSRRIRLSRLRDLPHELVHLQHFRLGQNPPDVNHELTPGQWTVEDNAKIDRVKEAYLDTFISTAEGPR